MVMEIVMALVAVAGAIVAALALATLFMGGARHARASDHALFAWVMPAVVLKTALQPIFGGRSFAIGGEWALLNAKEAEHPAIAWMSRAVSIFVLICCLQVLWTSWLQYRERRSLREQRGREVERLRSEGRFPGRAVMERFWAHMGAPVDTWETPGVRGFFFAYVALIVGTVFSPALLGAHPRISHEYLYALTIGLTAVLIDAPTRVATMQRLRDALLLFTFVSLLFIALRPSLVLDASYAQGWLGALPRFAGLAPHAVSMSMMSLLGLLLAFAQPYRRRWLQIAALALFGLSIFIAQSKMGWITVIAILGLMMLRRSLMTEGVGAERARRQRRNLLLLALGSVAVALMVAPIVMSAWSLQFERFLSSAAGTELATGTGRDVIWEVALTEWRHHPLFGYGPLLFDETYREAVKLPFATHGHNQIIDALGRSGLVGATSVVIFIVVTMTRLVRLRLDALSLPGYLMLLLLLRCVSEVPLDMLGYGQEQLAIFLLLVSLPLALQKRAHASPEIMRSVPSPIARMRGVEPSLPGLPRWQQRLPGPR